LFLRRYIQEFRRLKLSKLLLRFPCGHKRIFGSVDVIAGSMRTTLKDVGCEVEHKE
jgi:hypothetical protein